MTKTVKRIGFYAVVLVLLVLSTSLAFYASASEAPQASWGESASSLTGEGTFAEAIEAVNSGEASYIRLESSFSCDESLDIRNSVTIDYNGVTVRSSAYFLTIEEDAVVTLKDSAGGAKHYHTRSSCTPFCAYDSSTLIIESGYYESVSTVIKTERNGYPTNGSVVINGGEFVSGSNGIINAWGKSVTINGGTFRSDFRTVYLAYGTLTLSTYIENFCIYFNEPNKLSSVMLPETVILVDDHGNVVEDAFIGEAYLKRVIQLTLKGEGTDSETVRIPEGGDLPHKSTFVAPEGKIFVGWSLTKGGEALSGSSSLSGGETLYAVWDDKRDVYIGGIGLVSGDYLASGASTPTREKPDSFRGYAYYENGVLTLHNFFYSDKSVNKNSSAAVIVSYVDLTLSLSGYSAARHTLGGISVEGDLLITGDGELELFADENAICTTGSFTQRGAFLSLETSNDSGIAVEGDASLLDGSLLLWHYGIKDAFSVTGNVTVENAELQITCSNTVALSVGGELTVRKSRLELSSYSFMSPTVFVSKGDLLFENSTVIIDSGGLSIFVNGKLTARDTVLALRASFLGAYAAEGIELSGKGSSVYIEVDSGGHTLAVALDADIKTEGLLFVLPKEAVLGERTVLGIEALSLVDADGEPLSVLLLNSEPLSFSADYAMDSEYHWHEPINCPVLDEADILLDLEGGALGEHTDSDACTLCGYERMGKTPLSVGGVFLKSGDYLGTDGKVYIAKPENMGYAYYKDGTLTLVGYTYSGPGRHIYVEDGTFLDGVICSVGDLRLVLEGENTLVGTGEECIDVLGNLIVEAKTGASLTASAESDGIYVRGGDLVIKNVPSLTVLTGDDGLDVTDGNITLIGSNVKIVAGDHGIEIDRSEIEGSEESEESEESEPLCLTVTDSILTIDAEDDGIDVEGDSKITGSTLTVTALDHAIDVQDTAVFSGSTLTLTGLSADAVRGMEIVINGSDLTVRNKSAWIGEDGCGIACGYFVMYDGILSVPCALVGVYAEGSATILGGTLSIVTSSYAVISDYDSIILGCTQGILTDNAELVEEGYAIVLTGSEEEEEIRIGKKSGAHGASSDGKACDVCGAPCGGEVSFAGISAQNGTVGEPSPGFAGTLPENVFVLYVGRDGTVYRAAKMPTEAGKYTALFFADAQKDMSGSYAVDFEISPPIDDGGASLLWLWITLPCVLLLGGGFALYWFVFRKKRAV